MTILARLLFLCLLVAAVAYGAIWLLANYVEPDMRETTITIPSSKFTR